MQDKALKIFSWWRIALAIMAGLAASSYLLWSSFDGGAFEAVDWTFSTFTWLLVAVCMMLIRDLAYMYRIRVMTDYKISWRNSFDVIMLWEFASALTPSVVGGSGVALYIVHKEGLPFGKSTAVVLITALLDELFYIVMVPGIILFVGLDNLFPGGTESEVFGLRMGTMGIFYTGYFFILILIAIIMYAIFINPRGFKSFLLGIMRIRFLRRWRYSAIEAGNDFIVTGRELKGKDFYFWLKVGGATFFSWTARFWVVNFILVAFLEVGDHFLIYGRQLVMWVIMLISPTPGSSGIAELAFSGFLGEFTRGLSATLALIWRLISFYPVLLIGSLVLPPGLRRVYSVRR